MNHEEMQALGRVLEHYLRNEAEHAQAAGDPPGHIADSLMTLDHYRQTRIHPHEEQPAGSPIGIVRDHPSHGEDSRGSSVVDRGSRDIEARWAKETIGLVAVELNKAYAQFDTTRDNCSIPSGTLCQASRRLEEAMQRLGLAEYRELDSGIPF